MQVNITKYLPQRKHFTRLITIQDNNIAADLIGTHARHLLLTLDAVGPLGRGVMMMVRHPASFLRDSCVSPASPA